MDIYNLDRFVEAQNRVYGQVSSELKSGLKLTHWMWFVFPQIRGLGSSAMTIKYSISSIEEAAEYLRHAILGTRLLECSQRWSKNCNSLTGGLKVKAQLLEMERVAAEGPVKN